MKNDFRCSSYCNVIEATITWHYYLAVFEIVTCLLHSSLVCSGFILEKVWGSVYTLIPMCHDWLDNDIVSNLYKQCFCMFPVEYNCFRHADFLTMSQPEDRKAGYYHHITSATIETESA